LGSIFIVTLGIRNLREGVERSGDEVTTTSISQEHDETKAFSHTKKKSIYI
jgi:hypothetical protein